MSNLIGDLFTGPTMLGGDPDEAGGPWHATIVGKTRFVTPKLSVPARLSGTVVGATRLSGLLFQGPTRLPFSGTIVGHSMLTGTLSAAIIPELSATIQGGTRFISPRFSHEVTLDFQGSVAAMVARVLVIHGQVLSGTGTVTRRIYQDDPQPVHFFV